MFIVAQKVLLQVLMGVLYLHSHGILHRDLTMGNLLLTKDLQVVSYFSHQCCYDKGLLIQIMFRKMDDSDKKIFFLLSKFLV